MNDQVIIAVANAIAANARALEALVSLLPAEVQQEVKVTPPKKVVQERVAVAQPVVDAAPVAPQPVEVPAVQPPPVAPFEVPNPTAPASAPAAESGVKAPFTSAKELTDYLMDSYRAMPHKGMKIEALIKGMGYRAVNEIKPDKWDAIYAGVEAIRNE